MASRVRICTLALLVTLLACVAAAQPRTGALAKGGKGPGKTATGSATLVFSPSSAAPYTVTQLSGCGYAVGSGYVQLVESDPAGTATWSDAVDSSGCIGQSWYCTAVGTYAFKAYQSINGTTTLMATASFSCL